MSIAEAIAPSITYDELVRQGREAREQADNVQWVEGDLALAIEVLPAHERPRDPETGAFLEDDEKALKRYAEDVDLPYSTLKNYRQASAAWPMVQRRTEVPWSVHQVLAAQEDRFDLIRPGMTYREAQRIVRDRYRGNSGGQPGWQEMLGASADALAKAEKHLDKLEAALAGKEHKWPDRLREKAEEYQAIAQELAVRYEALARLGKSA